MPHFIPSSAHTSLLRKHLWFYAYNALTPLCWPFLFAYYFLRTRTDGKYRTNFRYRLGIATPSFAPVGQRVWFHALSVGETLSAVPLVEALKAERPDLGIVFSTSTETGLEVARSRLDTVVEDFFTLPHDFPWSMRDLMDRMQPDLFALVETDLWPNLLDVLKCRGVPAVLVNGRISTTSFARLKRFFSFLGPLYGSLDLILAQSTEDKERYRALGVLPEQVRVLGNLKFDSVLKRPSASELSLLRESTGVRGERFVWIAGSTHEGEEEALLNIHRRLQKIHPNLLLILAPRHTSRAALLAELCRKKGFSVALRSLGESAEGRSVYLLDTLGELSAFYNLADAAFIGGSLVSFGGHNPLEAVACEKPTFWGPHLFNFREIEKSLLCTGCGRKVDTVLELESAVDQCLRDGAFRDKVKDAARRFWSAHHGSSREIAHLLGERVLSRGENLPQHISYLG